MPLADCEGMVWRDAFQCIKSAIHGLGLATLRELKAGDRAMRLDGRLVRQAGHPSDDNPNWVGVAPGLWIDPEGPGDLLNHACDANLSLGRGRWLVARRNIAAGEELTIDYSTTEADPNWSMDCLCGSVRCRRRLTAIQFAFQDLARPPPAPPALQRVWRNHRSKGEGH